MKFPYSFYWLARKRGELIEKFCNDPNVARYERDPHLVARDVEVLIELYTGSDRVSHYRNHPYHFYDQTVFAKIAHDMIGHRKYATPLFKYYVQHCDLFHVTLLDDGTMDKFKAKGRTDRKPIPCEIEIP